MLREHPVYDPVGPWYLSVARNPWSNGEREALIKHITVANGSRQLYGVLLKARH